MIKKILTYRIGFLLKALLCLSLFLVMGTTSVMAQFAISEDFRGNGNADIIIGGPGGTEGIAVLTSGGVDPVNGGYLRLTNSNTYQKGYAYVNKSFPSTMGVLVDFEYKMWRDVTDANGGADGIGVFLFDASSTFKLGGYGGSLGYAPNNPTTGLTGGYVGVGLDAYGNYSNESEWRIGGPGETPNAVVLRGPTTGTASTTNRYLTGVALGDRTGTNNNIRARNELDYNTVTATRPTDTDFYRRVQIEILRLDAAGIYYKIVVRWKKTPTSAFTDLVEYTTTDVPPALLKLGFAASSGASRNYHEIRNLMVTTPGNLRVVKRGDKDILRTNNTANGTITYTIEVTNDTNIEVQNVGFTDKITDSYGNPVPVGAGGFTISSITTSGFVSASLPSPGLLTTNEITGSLVLAAFTTGTITVTGVLTAIPPGNILQNTANVTYFNDSDLNNNTSTVRTPVTAEGVDVILTKTVAEQCVTSGVGSLFTVYASNIGVNPVSYSRWGTAGTRLAISNVVPPGYTYSDDIMTTDTSLGGFAGIDTNPQNTNVNARWSKVVLNNTPSAGYTTYYYIARGTDPNGASQQLLSGATYPYPLKYTMSPPSGTTSYNDVSSAALFSDATYNFPLEPAINQTNNDASIDMYVKPAAPTVPAGTVYYCIDDTATALQATATGTNTLRWYTTPNGFSSEFPITPNTNFAGNYTYYVSQVNGDCEGPQTPIAVRIGNDAGLISAAAFVCPGTATNITGTAVTNGTYRWQSASNINGPWTNMTLTTVSRTSGNLSTSTYFRRLTTVTLNGKTCESPSNALLISVNSPGTIGDLQTTCSNGNYDADPLYSVVAPVGNVTGYQWQRSTDGTNFTNVPSGGSNPSGTNETYNPASTNTSYYYQRVVSFSGCTLTSNPIRVIINANRPSSAGTISGPGTACGGTAFTITSTDPGSTSSIASYQWQSSTDNNNWGDISGATDLNYTSPPITATTYYRRVAVNDCGTRPSASVTVNVSIVSPGTLQPNMTICYGTSPGTLGGTSGGASNGNTGSGFTYRWEAASGSSGGTFAAIGPTGTGTTATSYTPGTLTSTMRYRRYVKNNSSGCEVYVEILVVVKQQSNPGTLSTTTPTACFGTSALINGTQATSDDTVTGYLWEYSSTGNINTWSTAPTPNTGQNYTAAVAGYYRRRATLSPAACGPIYTASIQITIAPNPTSVYNYGSLAANQLYACNGEAHPALNTGNSPAASVPAPGVLGYQWQIWNGSVWNDIPGATAASYAPSGTITQTTLYRRLVTATYNGTTICRRSDYGPEVTVNVLPLATGGQIGTSQIVCSGKVPPTINHVAPGTNTTGDYVWEYSTDNATWYPISGVVYDTYQPTAPITQTTYYRRFGVSNTAGKYCPGTSPSNVVIYTVPTVPVAGQIGSNQNVCSGALPALLTSVNPGSGGTSYQWQQSSSNTTDDNQWSNISGATADTYQPPADTSVRYFRRLNINNGCPSAASNVVMINVTVYPNPDTISSNETICSSTQPANITGGPGWPGGGTGTYRWYSSTDGTTFTFTGVTTQNYTFSGPLSGTTYYKRALISSPCYGEVFSNTVTKTVITTPSGGTIAASQTVCAGSTPANLTSTFPGSFNNYRWESSPNGSSPWTNTGVTTDVYTFSGALPATTHYRRASISGTCIAYSNTVIITVSAAINGGTASANQNVCNGSPITALTVTGSAAGTWRWDISSTGLANSWSPVSPSATGVSYTPASIVGTRYYRRATISGGCEGYSTTVTVSVSAATTAGSITGTQTICMDTTPTILGSPPGGIGTGSGTITYKWESSVNGTSGWTLIAGESGPTYQPPVLHSTRYYRRITVSTSIIGGITATCESGPTGTVVVTTKNCKVITNPMVRSRVN